MRHQNFLCDLFVFSTIFFIPLSITNQKVLRTVKAKMEKTLVLLKPSCIARNLVGEVISRIERNGLIICGMKLIQLDMEVLCEYNAHLVD